MSAAPKLYQLAARCPKCGKPPRIRVTQRQIEKLEDDPPGVLVQTYQCHWEWDRGRKCNHIYALTVRAFTEAEEV